MEFQPTTKVAEALALAQRSAQTEGHPEVTPNHLVSALVRLDTPQCETLLRAAGTGAAHVLGQADAALRSRPTTSGASQPPSLSRETGAVLKQADTLMRAKGDTHLALDILLLALAESGHLAAIEKRGAKDMEAKIDEPSVLAGSNRLYVVFGGTPDATQPNSWVVNFDWLQFLKTAEDAPESGKPGAMRNHQNNVPATTTTIDSWVGRSSRPRPEVRRRTVWATSNPAAG